MNNAENPTPDTIPTPAPLDLTALIQRHGKGIFLATALIVLLAALAGVAAMAYDLLATQLHMNEYAALANAAIAALIPLCLGVGAAMTARVRTRSMMILWASAWVAIGIAMAATDGALAGGSITANSGIMSQAGAFIAPAVGVFALTTIVSVLLTLRGADDEGALGHYLLNVFKGVIVLASSFGIMAFAKARGVTDYAYVGMFAVVVETGLITMLAMSKRSPFVNLLSWSFAAFISITATEVSTTVFHIPLTGVFANLPQWGAVTIALSIALATLSAVALALGKHAATERESLALRAYGWQNNITALKGAAGELGSVFKVARPATPTPAMLNKDAGELIPELTDKEPAEKAPGEGHTGPDMRKLRAMPRKADSRKCVTCGDTFTAQRADAKYCSQACRTKAARSR